MADRCLVHVHDGIGSRLATLAHATVQQRTFVQNDAGSASVSLPQGDDEANDINVEWSNVYVLESTVQGVPPWVGFLVAFEEDGASLTLTLRELSYLLEFRLTGQADSYALAAGAIVAAVLEKAQTTLAHPFVVGDMSDLGPYRAVEWRHHHILDVLRELADTAGYAWWLDARVTQSGITSVIRWASRRDVDRSDRVLLEESRNLEAYPRYRESLGQSTASATVVGGTTGGTAYGSRIAATAVARTPFVPVGLLSFERVVIHEEATDTQALQTLADEELAHPAARTVQVICNDRAIWPDLQMGADVRLRLPSYNRGRGFDGAVRIVGLSPDEQAGQMLLVVEVL